MKKHCFFSVAAFLLLAGFCCGAAEGTVNASWLNARVFPELKSPSAVKLPRGKKVEIFKRHGAWLEIAAPDITPVYASAAYIDGQVVIRDVNLRVRPHSKGAVIGRVKKGTVLKAVSEPDRYGWVQLAPLPELRLYVVRDYVTFDASQVPVAELKKSSASQEEKAAAAPVKKEEAKAAPAPVKKEEKKAAPAPVKKEEKKAAPALVKKEEKKAAPAPVKKEAKKAAPAKKEVKKAAAPVKFELTAARKRELINIGSDITKNTPFSNSGRLVAVPNPSGDCTAVALIGLSDGRSLGFLFAEAPIELKKYLDKEVSVKGFAYRVKGWRNPVVAVTAVSEIGK